VKTLPKKKKKSYNSWRGRKPSIKKTINGRQPGKKQQMSSKTRRQPWVKNN
jgi:hypothetical protein